MRQQRLQLGRAQQNPKPTNPRPNRPEPTKSAKGASRSKTAALLQAHLATTMTPEEVRASQRRSWSKAKARLEEAYASRVRIIAGIDA